ncbi:MAG: ABC transporter ATP-binding protein [Nitrospirota bacterium]
MIKVIDINKSFFNTNPPLHVLKGIDLEIEKGEMFCIVGASGVGKSTFLHILGTLDRPTSGKVYYDDIDIFSLNDNQLTEFRNKRIGFIFQFHHLLPEFTAMENVAMPALIRGMNRREALDCAGERLREIGLGERSAHKPGELSGGEQQRVAIARALILEPDIILADEPTGNLDSQTSEEVFNILKEMNSTRGIIIGIITHNERLSDRIGRIIRMVDGTVYMS